MRLETERSVITELTPEMAASVRDNSQDADNRRYLPDEVFETPEDAAAAIAHLIKCRANKTAPQVCAVLLKDGSR